QEAGEAAHRDATAAATEAQRARSEIGHLRQRLTEVEQETGEAVRAGWLDDTAPDADPARAALAATDAERTAVAAWDVAREAARTTADRAREAAAGDARAELTAARAADAAQAATSAYEAEHRAAASIAAEERLAELLSLPTATASGFPQPRSGDGADSTDGQGGDPSGGTHHSSVGAQRGADGTSDGARRSATAHAATDGTRRSSTTATVTHTRRTPRPVAEGPLTVEELDRGADDLLTLLEQGVAAAERQLFELRTAAADDSRILGALGDGGLLPAGPDVLATVEYLGEHGIPALPGWRYLAQAVDPADHAAVLAARLTGDRTLAARLGSWREDCPPGMLAELAEAAATARETAEAAEAVLAEARTVRADADEAAAEAARVRDDRQDAAQRARRVADALAGLAYRLRERAGWQVKLRELADEAAESEARAATLLERAKAADEDRRTAQRTADDAHRTSRTLRAERAEIAGAPETLPEPDPDAPRVALPALREAYRAASQLYEKVGVGADLRAEQARAESDESAALTELNRLSNKVRNRAGQLLESNDGADGPSRQAAAGRAESLVQTLETRASAASEQLGRLRGEAERLAPDDGDAHAELADGLVPSDAEHAQTLLRTATAELATRTDELDTARGAHGELLHAHRAAEDAAGGFDETAALLRDLLRDHQDEEGQEDPEPYPGTLEEARNSAAEARRSLRGCAGDLSAAEAAVREASDILVRHANSTRYEQVRTPARQQIRELPAAALPEHAAAWAAAFAPRLRVLTDELVQLERNRDSIVDRLRGLVESSLATLRSAQRLSQLPEGLGEWSGQEFLRIRFEEPDQATLVERLGEVVDEATRAAVKKNSDMRRDGMSLLLHGVQAALEPKGIAVEILKPDAVLRAERVPVGQMGDVFSGGQLLTAAIALYCTMAALRSNDRGRDKHRHAGTLFLDNPIGRANATYLLELQRAVSDALGVQLLYTTGLFDTTALAEFPLVIRLRNDADLRAGLKYISVEEHLRPGLPQQSTEGETIHGEITATRMFKRMPTEGTPSSGSRPDGSRPGTTAAERAPADEARAE
ncbi:hypothetical protein ACWGIG_21985, partial [Streptomyces sp. NPDC054863]